ncbi:hypothetical protein L195_g026977 [Trifolium pratense]|uniref:Uncharacterized protein n=1 Tax=Trifolium pratense TaxID=57577 RepID=A0A2K3KXV4_TRIPR|nr:hypothetical protein L195_g026977 [Trifolium pratense]
MSTMALWCIRKRRKRKIVGGCRGLSIGFVSIGAVSFQLARDDLSIGFVSIFKEQNWGYDIPLPRDAKAWGIEASNNLVKV